MVHSIQNTHWSVKEILNKKKKKIKKYLPSKYKINMTKTDEKKLRNYDEMLLGEKNLHLTRHLTTTKNVRPWIDAYKYQIQRQ